MRVLLVSPYPPERDGIAAYTSLVRAELLGQGHETGVISARVSDVPRSEVVGSLPAAPWGSVQRAVSAARAFGPDVVHVQFAVAAYGALIPALMRLVDQLRELGFPVVVTMHEVTRDTDSLRGPGRALYRRVARGADRIIVHTESARRGIETRIADRPWATTVIAHPRAQLETSEVKPQDLRDRFSLGENRIVLAFGFIDVDKGLEDLVDAAGILGAAGELHGVRVAIAGEVRHRFGAFRLFELRDRLHLRRIKRKVSELALAGHVSFAGFVPAEEIRAWFDLAAVAVLPYRRSEQSGVASLALAAGTPVLTSDVGELGAMSCGTPFPPRDPPALARELSRFLRADAVRPSAGAPNADLAEIVAETVALYEQLARDGRTVSSTR
jgi:glycosyltransferase involved in cell wall biosynthesis